MIDKNIPDSRNKKAKGMSMAWTNVFKSITALPVYKNAYNVIILTAFL